MTRLEYMKLTAKRKEDVKEHLVAMERMGLEPGERPLDSVPSIKNIHRCPFPQFLIPGRVAVCKSLVGVGFVEPETEGVLKQSHFKGSALIYEPSLEKDEIPYAEPVLARRTIGLHRISDVGGSSDEPSGDNSQYKPPITLKPKNEVACSDARQKQKRQAKNKRG